MNHRIFIILALLAAARMPPNAAGKITTGINGSVTAIADGDAAPQIRDVQYVAFDQTTVAFAADQFGQARGEASNSLFQLDDRFDFDFSGAAYASSTGITSPLLVHAFEFRFIASTPVFVTASAHAEGTSPTMAPTRVYLRRLGGSFEDIFRVGQGFYVEPSTDGSFTGWVSPGTYELRVDLQVALDSDRSETFGSNSYSGSINVSEAPEPSSAMLLFGVAIIWLCGFRLRTNGRIA
jgi:hypothetical protein